MLRLFAYIEDATPNPDRTSRFINQLSRAQRSSTSLDFATIRSPEEKESPTAEEMVGAMVWGYGLRSRRPWAPTRLPGTSAVGCDTQM
ncbi:hypothetical protein VKT23_014119 [Stygiomarasmius scandens]|uniref:Uncharacterized protein n=1 Tax=Marasmiellus scandens TaxID=2682957 RepID=A0ABR1J1C5_9AGAR